MSYTYSDTIPAVTAPQPVFGTLKSHVGGKFTTWKLGTRVKVTNLTDATCDIERVLDEGVRMYAILDWMAGVPLEAIEMDAPQPDAERSLELMLGSDVVLGEPPAHGGPC